MKSTQGSVLGLMVAVLFAALALQTIRVQSVGWAIAASHSLGVLLLYAPIRARYAASREARAWWFGFAAIGWGHLVLTLIPLVDHELIIDHELITTKFFTFLFDQISKPSKLDADHFSSLHDYVEAKLDNNHRRSLVVHLIASVILAYPGAWLVSAIDRRSRRLSTSDAEPGIPPSALA